MIQTAEANDRFVGATRYKIMSSEEVLFFQDLSQFANKAASLTCHECPTERHGYHRQKHDGPIKRYVYKIWQQNTGKQ
jgi:hypothetical protein